MTVQICAQLIQVETYLKHEKSWRKPHTEEARLQRRLAKDKTELATLQNDRPHHDACAFTAADIRP